MYYCPYCEHPVGHELAGCCGEVHGITKEQAQEHDAHMLEVIKEYEHSQKLNEAYKI